MDCAQMRPIVNGLKQRYAGCLSVVEVNFHATSALRDALHPIGTPEFVLLDSAGNEVARWIGVIGAEEFDAAVGPLCE